MTFWDFDYLTICGGFALIALVVIVPFLLLGRRGRAQWAETQARWQAIGMTLKRGAIAGEHRGRRITMSYPFSGFPTIRHSDYGELAIRVRIQVRSPPGSRLTITPKFPQVGLPARIVLSAVPKTHEIDDHFSVHSNPPDLAARLLAVPRVSAILFSTPKPAIELKGDDLRFYRIGSFPDPQDALSLFDMVCDLAEIVEQEFKPPGAG
jgi:hypothetical protein